MNSDYVRNNQTIIDRWKGRIDILFYWEIQFVYDGEHWSHTLYDMKEQKAIIYPCDIQEEEDYLVHEVLKIAFIAAENNIDSRLSLISDLTALITEKL